MPSRLAVVKFYLFGIFVKLLVNILRVFSLTLNISERQEEEEYSAESGGGSGGSGNPNRGQHVRQKYQHPKGAPDADLIFGPKKFK